MARHRYTEFPVLTMPPIGSIGCPGCPEQMQLAMIAVYPIEVRWECTACGAEVLEYE